MALRKERIAQRLVELREGRGFSQEKAAAFVGVTVRQYQRWEAGESVPYPRNLEQIASRFGIGIEEFFDRPVTRNVQTDDIAEMRGQLSRVEDQLTRLLEMLAAQGLEEAAELIEAAGDEPPARRRAPGKAA